MAKRFDTARLFEPRRPPSPRYRSVEAELDAIRARKKALSVFWPTLAEVGERMVLAFERDLVVTLQKTHTAISDPGPSVQMFVSRPEELWRVPALVALEDTAFVDGRWTDASENLFSHLLGYSKSDRKRHIEKHRESQPAWTAGTAFVLLTKAQRAVVESVGRRCFGPIESLDGLVLFSCVGLLRRDALARVPKGMTLARAGIRIEEFGELFPATKRASMSLWERTLDQTSATILNRGLVSNVQVLTRSGWR